MVVEYKNYQGKRITESLKVRRIIIRFKSGDWIKIAVKMKNNCQVTEKKEERNI